MGGLWHCYTHIVFLSFEAVDICGSPEMHGGAAFNAEAGTGGPPFFAEEERGGHCHADLGVSMTMTMEISGSSADFWVEMGHGKTGKIWSDSQGLYFVEIVIVKRIWKSG